jgi:diacylglycerol kinase
MRWISKTEVAPIPEGTVPDTIRGGGRLRSPLPEMEGRFRAKNLADSVSFAWEGILYAVRTQRNFRIHLLLATLALACAAGLQIAVLEWAMLWACIGLVLFAELSNSALELFVDILTQGHYDPRAKAIKDMAAGAVFVTALSALACGICIFVPYIGRWVGLTQAVL